MASDPQEIERLEKERCAALTSGDVQVLRTLLTDDLRHVHGNGHVDGLEDYLRGVQTKFVFHRIERGDLDIRIYGDSAIVLGPLDQTVEVRGTDKQNEIKALVSQMWIREADGWKQNTCHMHFLSYT